MKTTIEPKKIEDVAARSDQVIIDAIKRRMASERRRKLFSVLVYLSIGALCFFMALLEEFVACSIFYLCLILYLQRNER
jgi:uncharacterized membrane protein HdeD (DUF308 family)